MSQAQTNQILELLDTGRWICTSDMYRLYMADPRRRLCDLKDKGYQLESRKCQQHDYHKGGSKEWRLIGTPPETPVLGQNLKPSEDVRTSTLLPMTQKVRDWNKQFVKEEKINQPALF